jgi:C-methyltransferase-like protein/putative zinc binding protein/methyltransferase family protein
MPLHDASAGHIEHCQICGEAALEEVIDLGHQPLCDTLLTEEQLAEPEVTYPLRLMRCPACTLSQLDYVVPGDVVYHRKYPYRAGITPPLVDYLRRMSRTLVEGCGLGAADLVVDIGSNDGTLLAGFKNAGTRVLGVEPTDIAAIAQHDGIETIQSFFDEQLAREIVAAHGHASMVTATNVFAHMAALGETVLGMKRLIGEDGILVIENHYLLDVLEFLQFDTVYHEHIRTYSLRSLIVLFEQYELEVFDAGRVPRYGGSIRIQVAPKGRRRVKDSVSELLAQELDYGLDCAEPYARFRQEVEALKAETMNFLSDRLASGFRVVGNSCPGRCSTLINYYGIDRGMLPYIAEFPTSLKKGLYLPGKHIPIVDNSILAEEQPDYVVMFAWHYRDEMIKSLRESGVRSHLVQPLPELQIFAGDEGAK